MTLVTENAETKIPAAHAAKQAVVLVHGMGEQIPMDTIRGFVTTVWELDEEISANGLANPSKVWSKPDDRTGSLELRRITTRESVASAAFRKGVRTDFYELYWADLTAGSTWDQFVAWVWYLLFRRWSQVPRNVRSAWLLLWGGALIVVAMGLLGLIPQAAWKDHVSWWLPQNLVIAVAALLGAALHQVATRTFGRVVRYTRADPDNIASRAAVRARGLALLRALHRDGSYQRVVLVGHSLGSILAYDLLSYFWAEQLGARTVDEGSEAFDALIELEQAVSELENAPRTEDFQQVFRTAQSNLRHCLVQRSVQPGVQAVTDRWLISDFVTLGSPLTHAEFLLAKNNEDLKDRQSSRELPTAPPYREELDRDVYQAALSAGLLPEGGGAGRAPHRVPGGNRIGALDVASRGAVCGCPLDEPLRPVAMHRPRRSDRRPARRSLWARDQGRRSSRA